MGRVCLQDFWTPFIDLLVELLHAVVRDRESAKLPMVTCVTVTSNDVCAERRTSQEPCLCSMHMQTLQPHC